MDIFSFDSYKDYVNDRVRAMPQKGHGQFMKIAKHIGVNPVVVTQTLKGERNFSEEHGLRLAEFFGLSALETDYFMRLIACERAGTHDLKDFHLRAMKRLRAKAKTVKNRLAPHQELDEAAKAIFYSDWTYSAVRLLTSIEKYQSIDALSAHLGLSRSRVSDILEFLVATRLCNRNETGQVTLGIATTHLSADSRFINNHRRNWRLKGLESLGRTSPAELMYSGPCTLSSKDFDSVKSELLNVIANFSKRIPETDPEFMACLNIDFFKM